MFWVTCTYQNLLRVRLQPNLNATHCARLVAMWKTHSFCCFTLLIESISHLTLLSTCIPVHRRYEWGQRSHAKVYSTIFSLVFGQVRFIHSIEHTKAVEVTRCGLSELTGRTFATTKQSSLKVSSPFALPIVFFCRRRSGRWAYRSVQQYNTLPRLLSRQFRWIGWIDRTFVLTITWQSRAVELLVIMFEVL